MAVLFFTNRAVITAFMLQTGFMRLTRLTKYFTHLVDLANLIKDTESIPHKHQRDFEQWLKLTNELHNKLRGFEVLDTNPFSRIRKL